MSCETLCSAILLTFGSSKDLESIRKCCLQDCVVVFKQQNRINDSWQTLDSTVQLPKRRKVSVKLYHQIYCDRVDYLAQCICTQKIWPSRDVHFEVKHNFSTHAVRWFRLIHRLYPWNQCHESARSAGFGVLRHGCLFCGLQERQVRVRNDHMWSSTEGGRRPERAKSIVRDRWRKSFINSTENR